MADLGVQETVTGSETFNLFLLRPLTEINMLFLIVSDPRESLNMADLAILHGVPFLLLTTSTGHSYNSFPNGE